MSSSKLSTIWRSDGRELGNREHLSCEPRREDRRQLHGRQLRKGRQRQLHAGWLNTDLRAGSPRLRNGLRLCSWNLHRWALGDFCWNAHADLGHSDHARGRSSKIERNLPWDWTLDRQRHDEGRNRTAFGRERHETLQRGSLGPERTPVRHPVCHHSLPDQIQAVARLLLARFTPAASASARIVYVCEAVPLGAASYHCA